MNHIKLCVQGNVYPQNGTVEFTLLNQTLFIKFVVFGVRKRVISQFWKCFGNNKKCLKPPS